MYCTFLFTGANAQPNLAFYTFNNQFNSFDYNPAFLTSREKFTFSIFPLAGTNIGYNNQRIIKNMASQYLSGNISDDDYNDALIKMVKQSSFQQNLESSLLSFTYRSEFGFFNFRIKDSEFISASFDGPLTQFIANNDVTSVIINQLQYLPAQAVHYREYSLGYAYKSRSNKFSAGVRAKLYYGKSAFFSNIAGSIQQDKATTDYILKTSGTMNISFPNSFNKPNAPVNTIDLSSSTIFDYLLNTGNPGMGIDLGINYRIMPELSFSMSVIDLGKINWKKNLYTMPNDIIYTLPKHYTTDSEGGVQKIIKGVGYKYTDPFIFSELTSSTETFSKPLPAKLYAGVKYQVSPIFSIGITDRLVVIKDLSYNSFSVAGKLDVNKILSVSTGYSVIGDSYLNIPLAFLFQANFGQFYLGTDNMTALWLPNYAQFAGISFGACFYLFTQRNLYGKPSNLTPFYRPRKIIKNRRTGRHIKANPDYN